MKASKWGLMIALATSATALAACGSSGGTSTSGNDALFTSAGFQKAYDAVKAKAGGKPALQLQITQGGADFKLRDGEKATGFVYTGGDVHDEEVQLVGPGSIEGQDFPFSLIDPAAIDKIVSGVKSQSGVSDIKVTVMTLEKSAVDGQLKWAVNAEGGGRTGLVYTADPDGSNVTSPLGGIAGSEGSTTGTTGTTGASGGGVTAPNGKTPQEILQCIQQAGGDASKIQACSQ
ncbi:MAG: hypothetical protein ACJ75Z_05425 [Solirubrobacterales bacterium]